MKRSHKYTSGSDEDGEREKKHKREKKSHKKKSHKRTKKRSQRKKSGKQDFEESKTMQPSISQEIFKQAGDTYISNVNTGNEQMLMDQALKLFEISRKINNPILPNTGSVNAKQIQNSCTIKSSNDGNIMIRYARNEKICSTKTTYQMNQNQTYQHEQEMNVFQSQ
jgi:hypothetical protein